MGIKATHNKGKADPLHPENRIDGPVYGPEKWLDEAYKEAGQYLIGFTENGPRVHGYINYGPDEKLIG